MLLPDKSLLLNGDRGGGDCLQMQLLGGPTDVTPQTLVQQVAYTLSNKLLSYSPADFHLDQAAQLWSKQQIHAISGEPTQVLEMQTRTGAAAMLLGYIFGYEGNYSAEKRNETTPQSVVASTATLDAMRGALMQLRMVYSLSTPMVAHIASVDYSTTSSSLISDYATALEIAAESDLALVASHAAPEIQHMALFSTLIATILPTIHIYDGVHLANETAHITDVLDQKSLIATYQGLHKSTQPGGKKKTPVERMATVLESLNHEFGTDYKLFEYEGDAMPDTVLVVFGSNEASIASQTARLLANSGEKIGVISVRIAAPFSPDDFFRALPTSTKKVAVLGQVVNADAVHDPSTHSTLFKSVLAAVTLSNGQRTSPSVVDVKYAREEQLWDSDIVSLLNQPQSNGSISLSAMRNASHLDDEFQIPPSKDAQSDQNTPAAKDCVVDADQDIAEEPARVSNQNQSALYLSFKEAYGYKSELRPDLGVKTFAVKVQENKRLTPHYYNRNIFHIEFDLGQSGLTYDLGEALGVHGQNDADLVEDFIDFYELDPDSLVEVPSRENAARKEVCTIHQAVSQNLDIFGRPPKKFYVMLADYATDETQKKELLTLGGSEGVTEFKRRAEVETITYADLLIEFTSARPSFQELCGMVAPLKRREYSIASSQKVHPNSVHLLVVVVDWQDPRGRDRYGHCSRYLSRLGIGDEVIVSVKPSVMKLPPSPSAPIIMAGLGTGLAPFRAFVEYRAWQKSQGHEIGPVMLYMGSRHQKEEYLYGEEWEAYLSSNIITHLGCAFSRDQPKKVYIQNRMQETLPEVIDSLIKKTGSFYLCGPTWPVPDVTQVLQDAIAEHARENGKKVDTVRAIEELKDASRYVLEVY